MLSKTEPRAKRPVLTLQRPSPVSAPSVATNDDTRPSVPRLAAADKESALDGKPLRNTKQEWREWHESGPTTPVMLDAKDISWIIEGDGKLAGRTIVGLRNAAEPALVLNERFDTIDAWWGRRCVRPRKYLTLAGNKRRATITKESIAYLKPMKRAGESELSEDKAVAGLRGRNVKPVPVAIGYQALKDWLSEER